MRGSIGEAGIELAEAIHRHKGDEKNRWRSLVKEFPFAITGVDPADSLHPHPDLCRSFIDFVRGSHQWLEREFSERESDFWEEMASFGCYWVRFKSESDLIRYKYAFSNELDRLEFKEPKNEQS